MTARLNSSGLRDGAGVVDLVLAPARNEPRAQSNVLFCLYPMAGIEFDERLRGSERKGREGSSHNKESVSERGRHDVQNSERTP